MNETDNRFTYRGRLTELMPIKTFKSGFKTREFVCATTRGEYTDYAVFTAKKDLVSKLDSLKPGNELTVTFALDGHAWNGPDGMRWFGGAVAFKVELASGVNAGSLNLDESKLTQDDDASDGEPDSELPF